MDHHPMDDMFAAYLEIFNFAFSLCFMLEMALKVRTELGRPDAVQE